MSERKKKSNPKQNLMNYLINTGQIQYDEEFIVGEPDINAFKEMKQELALHSEDAKQAIELLTKFYFESETVKKFREDLKKDFNEQQLNEILEKSNETINIFEKLVIELEKFNENFETIKEFNEKGLKSVIFYPGFVFGPGDFNIYGEMMFDLVAGQFLGLPGKGNSLFCMTFFDDVINGMVNVIDREDLYGQGFVLGGENIKIGDYLTLITEIAGTKKPRHFPRWMGLFYARVCKFKTKFSKNRIPYITPDMIIGMDYNWAFSSQSARKKLNYKITPIREGLTSTIRWYEDFINANGKKKKKIGIRVIK